MKQRRSINQYRSQLENPNPRPVKRVEWNEDGSQRMCWVRVIELAQLCDPTNVRAVVRRAPSSDWTQTGIQPPDQGKEKILVRTGSSSTSPANAESGEAASSTTLLLKRVAVPLPPGASIIQVSGRAMRPANHLTV